MQGSGISWGDFSLIFWASNLIFVKYNPLVKFNVDSVTPFGLNIMYLVSLTLTAILLTLNQLANLFTSTFTLSISSFKFRPDFGPAVSSANKRVKRLVTV